MKTTRLVSILALAAGAACAEAGGETTGGDLTPAGKLAVTPPAFVPPAADAGGECGTGSKWSELYRDIFASEKAGSCNFAPSCHGSAMADGALSGGGIKCFDEAGCRQSMISQNLALPDNAAKPEDALLFTAVLRTPKNPSGIMPRAPGEYVFPQACIDRISAWIAKGVPAD